MSKDAKNILCNHGTILQAYEQLNVSTEKKNKNVNTKSSLKRTESKIDDNNQNDDTDPEIEGEADDTQEKYNSRCNKRGNKAPRTDTYIQGKTKTTNSQYHLSKHDKNETRHLSPQVNGRKNEEKNKNIEMSSMTEGRKSERRNDNQQMSNMEGKQDNSVDDVLVSHSQNCYQKSYKEDEREHNIQKPNDVDKVHVSRQALRYAVEDKLPPLKIQCDPPLKKHEDGAIIVKEFLKHSEKDFKRLNPSFKQPYGFDHYMIDSNGCLICFTNYIELFIYMCNINIYPDEINKIKVFPILPKKLPAKNAVILKFIDNQIEFEDVQMVIKEKLKSVYAIEEMMGTKTYRSRHIRVDLLSTDEYSSLLNSGKFVIGGHLYEIDEFIPAPKILICSKCNTPGHTKKNCKSNREICRRCGMDRNDGINHKDCCIKCHHCGDDHEATNFKCLFMSKFRQELIHQLKNNTHLLPYHVQLYIPQQFRDQKREKTLMNKNVALYKHKTSNDENAIINTSNNSDWPALKSDSGLPSSSNTKTSIWNNELRRMHEEFTNLKEDYESKINQVKNDCEYKIQQMTKRWELINIQIKIQDEAVNDIFSTVTETLTPIAQSIQLINKVLNQFNRNNKNKEEQQLMDITCTMINDITITLNDRLHLFNKYQKELKNQAAKQKEVLKSSMYSTEQLINEL